MQGHELARLKSAGEQVAAAVRRLERAMTHLGKVSGGVSLSVKLLKITTSVRHLGFDIRDMAADELKGK